MSIMMQPTLCLLNNLIYNPSTSQVMLQLKERGNQLVSYKKKKVSNSG